MTVPLQLRLLAAARRRARSEIATMPPEEVAAGREPYAPAGSLLARVAHLVVGRPRPDVERTTTTVPGAAGPLSARRHEPATVAPARPLVLHLHGGGFMLGGPVHYDWFCGELAAALGAVVVSVDYRRAPEHPAPAAAEDAAAVARWLLDEGGGRLGATGPLVVAGDSAGGNLAALAAIAVRDAGLDGLAAQLLVYPATDLTMTSRSARTLTHEPMLHRRDMEGFVARYLGDAVAPEDPRVSPLHVADLTGLAPACVQTAQHDPLRDEGRAYAQRLADAGVPVRHTEYVDMPHGFVSLPGLTRSARQAVAELIDFTRPLLA